MVGVSFLIGANGAAFAYFGIFRHFKIYIGLPLTIITFFLAKNFSLKGSINRVYYPMEQIYQEVRHHQTVSDITPEGASGIRDI